MSVSGQDAQKLDGIIKAHLLCMSLVFNISNPLQIHYVIICWIAINMIHLWLIFWIGYKSFGYQAMHFA